ncbi:MAG: hypothetical protein P8K10_01785 [Crocinitomicaceae bacterium]|nr:hypothetical protein [Crocinitomicaceae bacterium]
MIKVLFFIAFFLPNMIISQYLFNNDSSRVFYKGFTNIYNCDKGTPLCFDGSLKITISDKENQYYVEVLDSVSREEGKLNIAKYLEHPDGFTEKVFIDKFSFTIKPLPETTVFIGKSTINEKINKKELDLKVGFFVPFPSTNFLIKEYTIIANKKVLIIKSSKTTQQAIDFIQTLSTGTNMKIEVVYMDVLKKQRRIQGSFSL